MSNDTLLLLDSHPLMRSTLCQALENEGYLVITAADLGSAVDRLAETKPDLLIIRPYINSMPGDVAAAYLRTKCPGLPVLFVAGFLDDDRITNQNAIQEFYTFPTAFASDEIVSKIRDVLTLESAREKRPRRVA